VCAPVEPQEIEYHAPVTFTSSLNVIVIFESRATSEASASGEFAPTRGAWSESQKCTFELFRGAVAAAVKSAAFWFVSSQPPLLRCADVVFDSVGAAAEPSKKFALPYPTRSMMRACAAGSQEAEPPLHPSEAVPVTSATFPAVPLMLIGVPSVPSGAGSGAPTAAVEASWTRK
jgi:hypothetical protein